MKMLFVLGVIILFLMGCASLKDTVQEIAENPSAYFSEAKETAENASRTFPEIPYVFCIGFGYGASFLRRWYKNIKIQQAINNS